MAFAPGRSKVEPPAAVKSKMKEFRNQYEKPVEVKEGE